MSIYLPEKLRERKNLKLVYMRSNYQSGQFKINETIYDVEKVNRANLRYNEIYDYRITHLNIIKPDPLAFGCYEVYVLKCDDDNSDVIKYRHKLASSTFADLKIKLNSLTNDLNAVIRYIESKAYQQ